MANNKLQLSNAVFYAAHIVGIADDPRNGIVRIHLVSHFRDIERSSDDGVTALRYAGLERQAAEAHYAKMADEYDKLVREGQIDPHEFRRPELPEANPEQLF